MSSLFQLVSRVRAWRVWRMLRRPLTAPPVAPPMAPSFDACPARPLRRDATVRPVRVYSLCGTCGATLGASATLCEACARSRTMPRA